MKILHLDIETAPNKVYTWGLWNQNVGINQIVEAGYTMCWAAKWHGSKEVAFNSIYHSSTEDMLKEVFELINEADAIVHYNGEKFDMPTLNREFLLYDLGVPEPYHHIDLLKVVRQRFKFPSNKLDYVAQALGLGAKTQHKGMDLWKECMNMEKSSWNIMAKYNKQDVKLTESLYNRLIPWIQKHPNHALYQETTRPVCPNCGSENIHKKGIETTLTMKYQRYKCVDCGTPIRGRTNIGTKKEKANTLSQSKL
jgi:DNA polymerase elongation subunit (family B)